MPKIAGKAAFIAYFSMEVGIDPAMPTYSGGLGVLAGDSLRAAADMEMPMVGVTLLHRKGYICQELDAQGNQSEVDCLWSPEALLEPLTPRALVAVEGRQVQLRAWRYPVRGLTGHVVPLYFLDTALPENSPYDQTLTDHLYGGDGRYRLCQEVVLGMGGIAMLRALGLGNVAVHHMNEGHAALLALALLEEQTGGRGLRKVTPQDMEAVRQRCVFTTHTPVPAGHDQFPLDLASRVLGEERAGALARAGELDGTLNMTHLALSFSRYINGVSLRHEEISRGMFPNYPISSVSNGVHATTWTSEPFKRVFDRHVPHWRQDNRYLRSAVSIPLDEVRQAHAEAKAALLEEVGRRTGVRLDPGACTLGFARRATAYKRADLFFADARRLRQIAREAGPLQVLYGGKAHPWDEGGKALIRRIVEAAAGLRDAVRVLYLENYDMELGKYLCSGVDLWLNTPQKPYEASGTSGMKAALNGVPSLSVLDGWWIDGHVEGVTGWSIGEPGSDSSEDAASLYDKLEHTILPMFYRQPGEFAKVMRSAIALNGSYFNAQRMLSQYQLNAYTKSSQAK